MNTHYTLHHGSCNIIPTPAYGVGKVYNDYGQGFYCTEHIELAKEWSCATLEGGYVNTYTLDSSELKVCDLTNTHILHWMAILLAHRTFKITSPLALEAKTYLLKEFGLDLSPYDVIIGYRADDSYFSFANSFLSGTLSLGELSRAMELGKLGTQVMIKSQEAFERLNFVEHTHVDGGEYYPKRERRDSGAREMYREIAAETKPSQAVYILDILREGWTKDDARL